MQLLIDGWPTLVIGCLWGIVVGIAVEIYLLNLGDSCKGCENRFDNPDRSKNV